MAKRDERSRLIDNIGRQIRRLNERERNGNLDDFQKRGLERQREQLNKFRDEVKKLSKTDTVGIAKAKQDYKSNGNYSSSQKKIDEITKRIIASQPDYLERPKGSDKEPLPPDNQPGGSGGGSALTLPDNQPGGESEGETGDDGIGGIIGTDPGMEGIFEDLAQLDGVYIGKYATMETKEKVIQTMDKIKQLNETQKELTSEQRETLNALYQELESKSGMGNGNFAIMSEDGQTIGYSATFNHSDFESYMNRITEPMDFDLNKWIKDNADLFNEPAPHRGKLSYDEQWEKDNAGILGNWEV